MSKVTGIIRSSEDPRFSGFVKFNEEYNMANPPRSNQSMIEIVARAIFETGAIEGVTLLWEEITEGHRELLLEHAVAAIDAIRNPTNAMLSAAVRYGDSEGYGHVDEMDALRIWEDMMSAVDISDTP